MRGLEIKMEKELKKCIAGFITTTDIVRRSRSVSSAIYRDNLLCPWNSAMDEVQQETFIGQTNTTKA